MHKCSHYHDHPTALGARCCRPSDFPPYPKKVVSTWVKRALSNTLPVEWNKV